MISDEIDNWYYLENYITDDIKVVDRSEDEDANIDNVDIVIYANN